MWGGTASIYSSMRTHSTKSAPVPKLILQQSFGRRTARIRGNNEVWAFQSSQKERILHKEVRLLAHTTAKIRKTYGDIITALSAQSQRGSGGGHSIKEEGTTNLPISLPTTPKISFKPFKKTLTAVGPCEQTIQCPA